MGALEDIVDVCVTLSKSSKDPRVIEAAHCIQSLTFALQSEQAAMSNKNSQLAAENLDLRRRLFDLEISYAKQLSQMEELNRGNVGGQTSLTEENTALCAENVELKRKIAELEDSKGQTKGERESAGGPAERLERQTAEVLKFFFSSANDLSSLQVALALKLSPSVAERHLDELLKRGFIVLGGFGDKSSGYGRHGLFRIGPEGLAYIESIS